MALTRELGNFFESCRVMRGIHRSTYYRWRRQVLACGRPGALRPGSGGVNARFGAGRGPGYPRPPCMTWPDVSVDNAELADPFVDDGLHVKHQPTRNVKHQLCADRATHRCSPAWTFDGDGSTDPETWTVIEMLSRPAGNQVAAARSHERFRPSAPGARIRLRCTDGDPIRQTGRRGPSSTLESPVTQLHMSCDDVTPDVGSPQQVRGNLT